jgi:outer membrane receptor protein involved in Fe transport
MRFSRRLLPATITALSLAAAMAPLPAAAQQAQGGIEELTVTARKKEESLQDAPIPISAFSGEGLEQRGVTRLAEIENFTPSMTFQNNPSFSGASSSASIYLRGIGQKEFLPTVDPGVGLYWSCRDDQFMDSFNTPEIAQDAYSLVNASLTWHSARKDWSVMPSRPTRASTRGAGSTT